MVVNDGHVKINIVSKHYIILIQSGNLESTNVMSLEVSFLCINSFLHLSFGNNYVSCYSGEMGPEYS